MRNLIYRLQVLYVQYVLRIFMGKVINLRRERIVGIFMGNQSYGKELIFVSTEQ